MAGIFESVRLLGSMALIGALVVVAGCSAGADETEPPAPRFIQPGAPGEESVELDPDNLPEVYVPEHTDLDVRFMQNMILHHQQALEMTRLVPERTSREDVPLFAERIELSQDEEIALMVRWLEERDEEVPGEGHAHDDDMPGMLADEQMARLEAASGPEFDRLFLQYMYYHHAGAIEMVQELLETDGAGEELELWRLLNHIDFDQRIELSRIDSMLAAMEAEGN